MRRYSQSSLSFSRSRGETRREGVRVQPVFAGAQRQIIDVLVVEGAHVCIAQARGDGGIHRDRVERGKVIDQGGKRVVIQRGLACIQGKEVARRAEVLESDHAVGLVGPQEVRHPRADRLVGVLDELVKAAFHERAVKGRGHLRILFQPRAGLLDDDRALRRADAHGAVHVAFAGFFRADDFLTWRKPTARAQVARRTATSV